MGERERERERERKSCSITYKRQDQESKPNIGKEETQYFSVRIVNGKGDGGLGR